MKKLAKINILKLKKILQNKGYKIQKNNCGEPKSVAKWPIRNLVENKPKH